MAGALFALLGVRWRRSGLPLTAAIRRFLAPPQYAAESDGLQASLLTAFLQGLFTFVLLLTPLVAYLRRDESPYTYLLLGAWANLVNAGLYILARRRVQLASWLLPLGLFVMITLGLLSGVGQVGLAPYLLPIVCAGLLLGARGALVYALLCSLAIGGAFFAASRGWLNLSASQPVLAVWIMYTAVFAVIAQWLGLVYRLVGEGSRRSSEIRLTQAERNRDLDGSLLQERKRARQLEMLASTGRRLAGLTDVQTLLDEATRRLVEVHYFDEAAIFLVEADELVLRSTYGRQPASRPNGARVILGSGIVGRAALIGETQREQTAVVPDHGSPNGAQSGSLACVPLRMAKSVVGVLEVSSIGSGAIEPADITPLESLADLIVAGLQTSGLFDQLRKQILELSQLNAITRISLETEDVDTLLAALADQMGQLSGADGSYLAVWDEDSQNVERIVGSHGPPDSPEAVAWLLRPPGLSLTEAALRTGGELSVPDLFGSLYAPQASEPPIDICSVLSVPLAAGGHWLGAAHIVFRKPRQFAADEVTYAGRAGQQVALAISKARAWQAERRRNTELETLRRASLQVTSSLDAQQR